jgi:uracil-DNA glycosylase family protein
VAPADRAAELERLRSEAAGCRACDLWARATQTVFGDGRPDARIMLVGEQPGDREDIAGEPFVGPAGSILDRALAEAGLDRSRVFITNVVKHFKWHASGRRRLHERPNAEEIRACRPWFEAEVALLRPAVVVLMGATAAQSALGRSVRIGDEPGIVVQAAIAPHVIVTLHPSAVLRSPDAPSRDARFRRLVADLALAAAHATA